MEKIKRLPQLLRHQLFHIAGTAQAGAAGQELAVGGQAHGVQASGGDGNDVFPAVQIVDLSVGPIVVGARVEDGAVGAQTHGVAAACGDGGDAGPLAHTALAVAVAAGGGDGAAVDRDVAVGGDTGVVAIGGDGAAVDRDGAALRTYQAQNGLEATGHLDEVTLSSLTRVDMNALSAKDVQQRLIDLGYLTGTADGIYGSGTANAVMKLQKANGYPVTGYADANLQALIFNGKPVNGKSIMNIMAACIKVGSEIDVICDGDGENEALAEAAAMIESGFGE